MNRHPPVGWQKHAAMTDLGDVVRRRNVGAWPKMLGVRCGAGVANAAAFLTVCVFVVLAGVVALELAGGLKVGGGAGCTRLTHRLKGF